MSNHIVLTAKQAARVKSSLLKAVEALGGIDTPAAPPVKKARKVKTKKAVTSTASDLTA